MRINCDDEGLIAAYIINTVTVLQHQKNIYRFCSMLLACSRCDHGRYGRCSVDRQLPSKAICKHPHLRGTFREAHWVFAMAFNASFTSTMDPKAWSSISISQPFGRAMSKGAEGILDFTSQLWVNTSVEGARFITLSHVSESCWQGFFRVLLI